MEDYPWMRFLWVGLAAIAGSITSLIFRPFKDMTRNEIALALFVGFTFAIFVGPWVASLIYGSGRVNLQVYGAIIFFMGSSSNTLVPLGIGWFTRLTGFKPGDGKTEGKP